jgi:hypothetical protein
VLGRRLYVYETAMALRMAAYTSKGVCSGVPAVIMPRRLEVCLLEMSRLVDLGIELSM